MSKEKTASTRDKVLSIVGIVLCVILALMLIINCVLLIQGWTREETEVPNIFGYFPMIVYSDSMNPEFREDDLILCKKVDPNTIEVGDVITFFDPDSKNNALLTHRVVDFAKNKETGELLLDDKGNKMFITRGDNKLTNSANDRLPVSYDRVVGEYTDFRIPGGGGVAMFLQTTPGMIVSVIVPILLLVGYDILRHKLSDKKTAGEKEDLMKELEELRKLKAEQESAGRDQTPKPEPEKPADAEQNSPAADDREKPE